MHFHKRIRYEQIVTELLTIRDNSIVHKECFILTFVFHTFSYFSKRIVIYFDFTWIIGEVDVFRKFIFEFYRRY